MTTFIIPDNAVIDNETITTQAGMIIGNHAEIGRNLQVGFLMAGESVHVTGQILSEGDIRADVWCKFEQEVIGGGDAYLGEFTTINGKITVEGDLDIGKEVKLNGGFLSKGWIVVRNPLPIMVFIFLYIRELMRLGKTSEEIDKTLGELFEDDEAVDPEKLNEEELSDLLNRGGFFVIPLGSKILSESINVPEDTIIGNDCVINTRLICKRFESGRNLTFGGVLRTKGETIIGDDSHINGELNVSGRVIIGKNVKIEGKVAAKSVIIHETSFVEGKVSSGNIRFAVGNEFDVKDPENPEQADLLSKADSYELIKTNITEKKESEMGADEEIEEYSAADSAEKDAETKRLESEAEEQLMKGDICVPPEENEAEADQTAPENSNSCSKRHSRRKSREPTEKVEIINVFTGKNVEEAGTERTEGVSEEEDSKSEEKTAGEETAEK